VKAESPADALPVPEPSFPILTRRGLTDWSLRIAGFGTLQGVVQVLLALAGLIIVRSLPKPEYALFAIANSMQVACTQLADLGVGIGMRSIGGRVWQDRYRLGQLLNTALGLRRQFAIASTALCLPITAWLLRRNEASAFQTTSLCIAVAIAVIPLLGISLWTATLLLHGQYQRIQKQDLGNAGFRLALIGSLALSRINAVLAACVAVVTNFTQAFFLKRWARIVADPAATPRPDDRKELLRLSVKALPNTVFFCFQGQVTILILTLLGSPTGIADITALGRLALLFGVFTVMFANVLAPRFARCQDSRRLVKLYLILVGGTAIVLIPLCIAAAVLPGPFLWLLGEKYSGLGRECVWVIALMLAVQILAVLLIDLRSFQGVLVFNLVSACIPLPLYVADAVRGLKGSTSLGHAAPAP
jgi:hypothetical protein